MGVGITIVSSPPRARGAMPAEYFAACCCIEKEDSVSPLLAAAALDTGNVDTLALVEAMLLEVTTK